MIVEKKKIIGLFGTCGSSTWRDDVAIPLIRKAKKEYFNPQKKNWTPKDFENEYEHLQNDEVIVHVILDDTYSFGSVAESGWIALGALLRNQKIGFYFEEEKDRVLSHEEVRVRKLIKKHLFNLNHKNVYLAKDISDLIIWAITQVN